MGVSAPEVLRSPVGTHFEVPLVTGDPLSMRPAGALPMAAALELAIRVASTLARHAPAPHGNLKEAHILVDQDGTVALIDPDPSHPGWTGTRSPEQAEGPPTRASDVYALGCLLFSWVSGEPVPDSALEEAVRNEQIQNLARYGLPLELQLVLRKMLRADPLQRVPSPEAVADALRLVNLAQQPDAFIEWLRESAWQRNAFWIRLLAHHETLDDAPADEHDRTHLDFIDESPPLLASSSDTGMDTLVDVEPDRLVPSSGDHPPAGDGLTEPMADAALSADATLTGPPPDPDPSAPAAALPQLPELPELPADALDPLPQGLPPRQRRRRRRRRRRRKAGSGLPGLDRRSPGGAAGGWTSPSNRRPFASTPPSSSTSPPRSFASGSRSRPKRRPSSRSPSRRRSG